MTCPEPDTAAAALPLDQLPMRRWARVWDVARAGDAQDAHLALRLTEIGFVPDEPVCVMARGLGGDPLAVRVGRATFALRRHEAALVRVIPQMAAPVRMARSMAEVPHG